MPEGAKTGEKIFSFGSKDFRDGLAFGLDGGIVGLGDPEEAGEEALAVENLAWLHFEDPSGDALHGLFAAVLGFVEPEALASEEERLDFTEVAEVLLGEDEAGEGGRGLADEAFGAFAGGAEEDLAGFAILAGLDAFGPDLLDADALLVEILQTDGFAGGFAVGGLAGEAGRGFGAGSDGRY